MTMTMKMMALVKSPNTMWYGRRLFMSTTTVSQTTTAFSRMIPAVSSTTAITNNNLLLSSSSSPSRLYEQSRRTYRGASGEEIKQVSAEEEELIKIAKPKADMIYQRHIQLPEEIEDNTTDLTTRQKRLIYRSKQRGWLEVDLLLGTWASQNVPSLSEHELDQFESFVNQETIDIYNVITLRVPVPDELKSKNGSGSGPSVVEQIQEWARSHPLGKADPNMYRDVKTEHKLI